MIYSCAYPINHTLQALDTEPIEYIILLNNVEIYVGRVYPSGNTSTVIVDISEVCRQYLEAYYENIAFGDIISEDVPVINGKATIWTFTVQSDSNLTEDDYEYTVMYNYNTDYQSQFEDQGNLNEPVLLEADPRQYLFIGGYNVGGANSYSYQVNYEAGQSSDITSNLYQLFGVNLNPLGLAVGDRVILIQNETSFEYKVVTPCRNRFAVYYVNKNGGFDALLCEGKAIESFNPTRTDIKAFNDRLNRRDFEKTRIYSDIQKRYTLNTGLLTDEGAKRIDHLIYTPKAFIHDLESGTITSCIVESSSFTVKNFRNDRLVQYTFEISESQLYIRL